MEEAMARSGRTNPSQEQLKTRLENARFVDVQSFTVKDPIGPWAKAKYGSLDSRGAMLQQFSCPAKKAYQAV
jgi:ABC-type sulfate transport system substrate-binding protein